MVDQPHHRQVPVEIDHDGIFTDAVGGKIDGGLNQFSDIAPIQFGMDDTRLDPGHIQQIINHAMKTSQRLLALRQGRLAARVVADLLCAAPRYPPAPRTEVSSARVRRSAAAPVAAAPMPRRISARLAPCNRSFFLQDGADEHGEGFEQFPFCIGQELPREK